jgi:hypothetical protein
MIVAMFKQSPFSTQRRLMSSAICQSNNPRNRQKLMGKFGKRTCVTFVLVVSPLLLALAVWQFGYDGTKLRVRMWPVFSVRDLRGANNRASERENERERVSERMQMGEPARVPRHSEGGIVINTLSLEPSVVEGERRGSGGGSSGEEDSDM